MKKEKLSVVNIFKSSEKERKAQFNAQLAKAITKIEKRVKTI